MGDGSSIRVAQDPWLLDAKSGLISTKLGSSYANTTVCDLMLPKEQQCDIDLIIDLFNARDRNLILNIPLSCRQTEDIWLWYWIQDVKGQHTVKIVTEYYEGMLMMQDPIYVPLCGSFKSHQKFTI